MDRGGRALYLAVGAAAAVALLAHEPGCLERREDDDPAADLGRCATCHGDAMAPGDFLQRAAPPRDLLGAADPSYPGVGAHRIHVYASETHGAIVCSECHVVPETTEAAGHADDARPAEVRFGPLASAGERQPGYDVVARRCGDSYCHRQADAVWTEPRSSSEACGSCHALPPPEPHPQSERCDACHGQVVGPEGRVIAPELHVDGKVQFEAGPCSLCHGQGDDPAPPADTLGNTAASAIGVGAHQAHLLGGAFSRPLACAECHAVPDTVDSPGHADALPAEVSFSGVASAGGRAPRWDRAATSCSESWCHGPSPGSVAPSPSWVEASPSNCTSCHGAPPPAPHPQITDCSRCHAEVVADDDVTIVNRDLHVDGIVHAAFDEGCASCHGGANPAPPTDLSGSSSTTSPGVGAHQIHLAGTARSRPVPCAECHLVPETALDAGHIDSHQPAELVFSGAAVAHGAAPSYAGGSCQNTACHGAVFPEGHASGGTNTAPTWTAVDGTQAACGACHSLPPPAPHPVGDMNPICSVCHENIAADNATFVRPDLHVDGFVTFVVP